MGLWHLFADSCSRLHIWAEQATIILMPADIDDYELQC